MSQNHVHQILSDAMDADEAGDKHRALHLYTQSVHEILQITDVDIRERLNKFASNALERAEKLKAEIKGNSKDSSSPIENIVQSSSSPALSVSGDQQYTEEEKRVLEYTSHINQKVFVPFMGIDLRDRFIYSIPFTDKDGHHKLSPKQKRDFVQWIRISELSSDPKLVVNKCVNVYSIKQTVVSDCSLVASLAVSALYEKRFGKRLITSIIYPRNEANEPIYNPCGKYTIKLHINGISRKCIIDDYLPVGPHNQLLCSYSNIRNEFWVSLIEKAYLKVMGGYDFPGSNSNIDLHALTGWIPERISIRKDEPDFNENNIFERLKDGLSAGRCLITVATGELSESQADRCGLVATHAYAVLDVREIDEVKLFQLKNPWSHLRWKGNYSELDINHWTTKLKDLLNYDPTMAEQYDNGVFWIDYPSILQFFDVFYLNWDPSLFQFTYCIHEKWSAGVGPTKDAYTIGDNPQYRLSVNAGKGSVWILLSRHITSIDDFRENKEYITLLAYKNNGKRVYYPYDPKPFIDGIRINSPHYLCKIKLNPNEADTYTLVVSQYEKTTTIYYTLRAYSRSAFKLLKINSNFPTKLTVNGKWESETAGGCKNHPQTYNNNPRYRLEYIKDSRNLVIELRGPKVYQIGLELTIVSLNDPNVTAPFISKISGTYRSGFCVLDLENLPAGIYNVIPSTYLPGQESPFILTFKSTVECTVTRII